MRIEQEIVEPLLAHARGDARARRRHRARAATCRCSSRPARRSCRALDFSLAMLDAQRRPRARVCGDACRLPFRSASFDLVNASLMVGDVADLAGWTREMARVLAAGGHLSTPTFTRRGRSAAGAARSATADGADARRVVQPAHARRSPRWRSSGAGLRVRHGPRAAIPRRGRSPSIRAFRRRWGNPPVVVVFHAVKAAVIWAERGVVRQCARRCRLRRRRAGRDVDPRSPRASCRSASARSRTTRSSICDGAIVLPGPDQRARSSRAESLRPAQGPRAVRERVGVDRRHAAAARRRSGDSRRARRIRWSSGCSSAG